MPQVPRWRGWWNEARVVASSGGGTPVGGRGIPHSHGCRRLSSSRWVQGMAAPQSRRSCCHFTTRLLVLLVLLTAATVRGERVPPSPERICTPRRARVVLRKVGLWWVFLLSLPLGCSKRHQRNSARMHTTASNGGEQARIQQLALCSIFSFRWEIMRNRSIDPQSGQRGGGAGTTYPRSWEVVSEGKPHSNRLQQHANGDPVVRFDHRGERLLLFVGTFEFGSTVVYPVCRVMMLNARCNSRVDLCQLCLSFSYSLSNFSCNPV